MDDFDVHSEERTVEHLRVAASYFYGLATTEYKYQMVETPAYADSPLFVKNEPNVDFIKVGSTLPQGARILALNEILTNEEALNVLMSWAIRLCFPEDE